MEEYTVYVGFESKLKTYVDGFLGCLQAQSRVEITDVRGLPGFYIKEMRNTPDVQTGHRGLGKFLAGLYEENKALIDNKIKQSEFTIFALRAREISKSDKVTQNSFLSLEKVLGGAKVDLLSD